MKTTTINRPALISAIIQARADYKEEFCFVRVYPTGEVAPDDTAERWDRDFDHGRAFNVYGKRSPEIAADAVIANLQERAAMLGFRDEEIIVVSDVPVGPGTPGKSDLSLPTRQPVQAISACTQNSNHIYMSFQSLQEVIASVDELEAKQRSGFEAKFTLLDHVISGMIGNAQMHSHAVTPNTVFAIWRNAKDVEDAYVTPNLGEEENDGVKIRKLTKAELAELDGYIADAREIFPETPNFELETRRLHEGLKTLSLKEEEFEQTELAAAGYELDDSEDDVLIAPKELIDAATHQIAHGDKFGAAIEYLTTVKIAKAVVQERAKAKEIAAEKS